MNNIEKYCEEIKKYTKKCNKKSSLEFLQKAGIIDANGNLKYPYKGIDEIKKTKFIIKDYRGTICEFTLNGNIDDAQIDKTGKGCYVSDSDEYEDGIRTVFINCN